MRSDIESAETITDSNHSIVWLQIDSSDLFEKNKVRLKKNQGETRRIYLYHKATKENWDAYRQKIDRLLIGTKEKRKKQHPKTDGTEEESVDKIQEQIVKAITIATNEYILST